jgi:hypothetical protein
MTLRGLGLDSLLDRGRDVLTSPSNGSDASRRRSAVVVAAVLAVVLVVAAVIVTVRMTNGGPATAANPAASPPGNASPPAELPAAGSAIRSRVTADGDVVVTHWIRSRFAVSDLRLPTPPDGTGAARVGDVSVVVDGTAVQPLPDATDPALRFVFGVPAKLVRLHYVLKHAVDQASSVPGRALVRTTFLPVEYSPDEGPLVVTVTASQVLSMTCSDRQAVLSSPRPCGVPKAGGWRVTLRGSDRQVDVMAQVDLGPQRS